MGAGTAYPNDVDVNKREHRVNINMYVLLHDAMITFPV
jgi:hypothetical protein